MSTHHASPIEERVTRIAPGVAIKHRRRRPRSPPRVKQYSDAAYALPAHQHVPPHAQSGHSLRTHALPLMPAALRAAERPGASRLSGATTATGPTFCGTVAFPHRESWYEGRTRSGADGDGVRGTFHQRALVGIAAALGGGGRPTPTRPGSSNQRHPPPQGDAAARAAAAQAAWDAGERAAVLAVEAAVAAANGDGDSIDPRLRSLLAAESEPPQGGSNACHDGDSRIAHDRLRALLRAARAQHGASGSSDAGTTVLCEEWADVLAWLRDVAPDAHLPPTSAVAVPNGL